MIPFFRKIRKKMADDNRPLKYARYAIGEIILVVIGILIALQINNWNETRLKEKKLESVYLEVQRELALNIKNISESIDYYEKKDSIIYLILNDKLTKQDYLDNPRLAYTLDGLKIIEFQNKGYANLNAHLDILPKNFNPILEKLNIVYEDFAPKMEQGNDDFSDFLIDYFGQLSDTKSWYVDYSYKFNYKNEDFLNYITNDFYFKNKAFEYSIYRDNLFLSDLKITSIIAYKALAEVTGKNDDLDKSIYFQTTEDLKKYTGKFKINKTDQIYNPDKKSAIMEFSAKNNQLILNIFDRNYTIHPHSKNVFIFDDKDNAKVTFLFNNSEITGIQLFNVSYYTNWTKIND